MKKHILIVSQCFYPESFRINDLARTWVRRGHRVTVVTGIPNYPRGKFYPGYGLFSRRKETIDGISVIRLPLVSRGKSRFRLALNYLSFTASGLIWSLFTRLRADIVFTYGLSPMTQALIGTRYAARRKIPHFLYVQDLWPESIEAVTGIHSPILIAPLRAMVDFVYRRCTKIFATSERFVQAIRERVPAQAEKVIYWPQYAESVYRPVALRASERPTDGCMHIMFTGNIGHAQGLDILPEAARLLKQRGLAVRFTLVGDGSARAALEKKLAQADVSDFFRLLGWQPSAEIPRLLATADVAFLSYSPDPLFAMTIPAKLQSYLACAKPVLAAADGETKSILAQADCGLCVPPGDAAALADAVEHLRTADLAQMAKNAYAYSRAHFRKSARMAQMDAYLCAADVESTRKR